MGCSSTVNSETNEKSPFAYLYDEPIATYMNLGESMTLSIYADGATMMFDDYAVVSEKCRSPHTLVCLTSEWPILIPSMLEVKVRIGDWEFFAFTLLREAGDYCDAYETSIVSRKVQNGEYIQHWWRSDLGIYSSAYYSDEDHGIFLVNDIYTLESGSFLAADEICK